MMYRRTLIVVFSLSVVVILAGCGGTGSPTPTQEKPTEAVTSPTVVETEQATSAETSDSETTRTGTPTDSPTTITTASQTPTASTTPTPTPTLTPTPTQTPTPRSTPTQTPEPTKTPDSGTTELTVTITNVIDGDTVDIEFENGSTDTVRLLGVDTPEVHVSVDPSEYEGIPDTEAGRECLRDWGDQASEYAKDELTGRTVTLQFDEKSDSRGSYGRLLGYLIVGGENFNYQLVSGGYARVYDSDFTQSDRFYNAEDSAQSSQTGVWECRSVTTPTETDSQSDGPLVVAEIHEDAEGNENENLNDEYVVFRNEGDEELDLSEWRVEDDVEHTYHFPDGFTLGSGEKVTLYTGSGEDTETELYWGSGSAIWNNGGDTVFVYDDNDALIIQEPYGASNQKNTIVIASLITTASATVVVRHRSK
ncbi:lamin tail domain-containing protein [Halovenus salina]|uniref:Lamin tail domain-containing protein n=1 Tax=Halovenus salina TaxID=1510225 RepID=A0ABD5W6P1_9EURY|nr:lamin tail domain-containing protein [Halovenus salina]